MADPRESVIDGTGLRGYRVTIRIRVKDKWGHRSETETIAVSASGVTEVLASLAFRRDLDSLLSLEIEEIGLLHDAEKIVFSRSVTEKE